ncbi:MAG: Na+:solute symporter [Saprospiraceae bacterium]|nr:Na+:solute symporter [Saprospiraceae bacterium]MCF8249474.1 Na+:solute symporter [Saprospiraceae bacterium]MCF8283157.1 Na+:solute symporter [Bacteroidales bacterium]MCF8310692.1 Na+:solute symporter [Saprospiraceae bacterium]MCF8439477.1 Na+:solute symporter [Saprospiraceae bacterium]
MQLSTLDWSIVAAFFILSLVIGVVVSKRAGESASEYFLSGRSMPWWLLGFSMVATTFSADTPNLVTDIVRKNGVSGNWQWWAFLLTGMLTVFVYAKLWRRSGVLTDLEFYELRYSGKEAAFLRGFRALYLGVFFNIMIMATVSLAAIKIGGVLLGLSPIQTILIASIVTVAYTSLGGLTGVIWTDFFQFIVAMIGVAGAAYVVVNLPQVGGLEAMLTHPNVVGKLNVLPDFNDMSVLVPFLIMPIAIQWWSVWYPGAEPGGGGYIAQRMLSAKNENHAITATLFFNIVHYALRPWPWIAVALASLIVFPDLASLKTAFPHLPANIINDDLAYPAMMTFLPSGLLGVIVAALIAAYMSTIATHLNWGSSYVVNDFYKRFIKPTASDKEQVNVGRISTVVLMVFSAMLALLLSNALQAFNILLQIGAGTGLIFILRWFWWRINAWSEISAMIISFVVACVFEFGFPDVPSHVKLMAGVGITTVGWIAVTFMTQPTAHSKLLSFYKLIKPQPTGWQSVIQPALKSGELQPSDVAPGKLPLEIMCMIAGCFLVYGALFGLGFWMYGEIGKALIGLGVTIVATFILVKSWSQVKGSMLD